MKPIEHRIGLSDEQIAVLREFERLALQYNSKVNLYSDASAEHFWERHVQHSLALASRTFLAGTRVVDWGTGGGLPGIPLAVAFPEVAFFLVDSVGKKTLAVQAMARRLGLDNVHAWHGRAEQWGGEADYCVSRATAPLAELWRWTERVLSPDGADRGGWEGRLICLKGGDLKEEVSNFNRHNMSNWHRIHQVSPLLPSPYFSDKVIVEVGTGAPGEDGSSVIGGGQ